LRLDLIATLRAGCRGWLTRFHRNAGAALVIGEIALGFVLVTGAALTARTVSRIEQARPGFQADHLLAFQVSGGLSANSITEWETQLAALPGVERVGETSHLPLDTDIPNWYAAYQPEGVDPNRAATLISDLRCTTPGYLPAMGARLLEGRYFTDHDGATSQPVAIVDDLLARSTWPGQSGIGKRIAAEHVTNDGFKPITSVVVGVVVGPLSCAPSLS
jgi:hypothetical protein